MSKEVTQPGGDQDGGREGKALKGEDRFYLKQSILLLEKSGIQRHAAFIGKVRTNEMKSDVFSEEG